MRKVLKETKDGTIIQVIVRPNSKENKIEGVDNWKNRIRISIKAPPVKGEANKELIKFLSKILGAKVEIIRGETSREKDLLVKGIKLEEVKKRLKL